MKRIILLAALLAGTVCAAQKKPLDHSVYDSWESVSGITISNDGRYVSYRITPQEGDAKLIVKDILSGKSIEIERGAVPTFTYDGKWAVFSIKAPFSATREAKIKKKKDDEMPKDSLGYLDLETFELGKIADVNSFKTSYYSDIIAYEVGSKKDKSVILWKIGSESKDSVKNADKYILSQDGKNLVATFKKDKKDSLSFDAIVLYREGRVDTLSNDKKFYSLPAFNEESDKFVYLESADSNDTGSKHCSVVLYDIAKESADVLVENAVNENADPFFSRLSDRIFLGLGEFIPENDTTIVDFETASLDIWNYDIYMTPPIQKANSKRLAKATRSAVINLNEDRHKIVPVGQDIEESVRYFDGGEGAYALVVDDKAYQISSTWDSNDFCDVYLVNLSDGSRRTVFTKLDGRPSLSPSGKYITWYTDRNWFTYRVSDGKVTNVTENIKGTFFDDEDDHPMPAPSVDRPHWLEGDEAFLLADKYDLFFIHPDGKKVKKLTDGRKNDVSYTFTDIETNRISPALSKAGVSKIIGLKDDAYATTFNRINKENGLAKISLDKGRKLFSFLEKNSFPVVVKSGNTIAYTKGNFNEPNNIYITTDEFGHSEKCSDINRQQSEYNWGNVQLVHWNAYDGTPLDGLLFTPEDLDPAKKYPMMIYFYEKYSETLYSYRAPAPSASTVNIPFYASRGYVVFIPDIVYTVGHPGESAYNCICAGAEAMCEQFGFIDKNRMAIQGQSWGGYQTAYLVTRTNMFAAAGAGAPVGNMTSAYGGIRWESGMVRAMQYEHGQSRIGSSLWDEGGLELYLENSPVFHANKVTTPTLIMHNDNDGAVPWYQGIEFFMSLRRFGSPAWLLEYNNEAHNLMERRNRKDLSIRLQQFFDHYLQGAPMPAWMKTGIPIQRKGQYFGYELTE
ncbi:MAG: prolyl oligopeptidase family serine peptidase [Bacteroidales bacterium]|nr:prolyl oligopeptidase family serine peptidase [Bacteroidales bacterium]